MELSPFFPLFFSWARTLNLPINSRDQEAVIQQQGLQPKRRCGRPVFLLPPPPFLCPRSNLYYAVKLVAWCQSRNFSKTVSHFLNSFSPAPDSGLGASEQFCPPVPNSESGTQFCFIKLVFEVVKVCILYNPLLSVVLLCDLRANFANFFHILRNSSTLWVSADATNSGEF